VQPLGLRIETASKAERGYRLSESAGLPPPTKWSQPPIAENASGERRVRRPLQRRARAGRGQRPGVVEGRDPEYLHQIRVGVRRLRSALHAFRRLLRGSQAKAAERPLKGMMQIWAPRATGRFCETLADAAADAACSRVRGRSAPMRAGPRRPPPARPLSTRRSCACCAGCIATRGKSDAARAERLARFAREALVRLHARLLKDGARSRGATSAGATRFGFA
jgi:inorganic triphosphatase YgiF